MREKYEKFLQFCSILEWDDAALALDVFYGVSNDEFPISLAVILTGFKTSKKTANEITDDR
jgi:hypothetical protein